LDARFVSPYPSRRSSDLIMGDPTRLSQILYNLVSNAIKHTNDGMVTIAITELLHTDSTTTLHFSVKDTGPGIPEAFHEEIFKDLDRKSTRLNSSHVKISY